MSACIFCTIVATRPDRDLTVFEDEHVIVQVALQQKARNHGHALVIPKRHVETMYDLPAELDAPLMAALRLAARAVKAAFNADGIHIRQNNEPAAGQDVFHLHFHVIPRFIGDEFETMSYARLPLAVRQEQAARLSAAIKSGAP